MSRFFCVGAVLIASSCPAGDASTKPGASANAPAARPAVRLWDDGGNADIWRPGCALGEWRVIEALQQYAVLPGRKEPDWPERLADAQPLVRAAACLAIGRGADPKHIPLLVPRLSDEWGYARKCALWALLQMDSQAVKRPLF
ncbi:MAG: HEAT repeat domain-containing protein, partial [Planctomycetota bacterium]